jgi:hypothetical protein
VPRVSRVAVVCFSVLWLGGCAAITGLDQIQESECAPDCDGGLAPSHDGTVDSPGPDGWQPGTDGTIESSDDSSEPAESSSDDSSGSDDGGGDADAQPKPDANAGDASEGGPHDAGPDAPPHDAGPDSPCGPTDTTVNCGACGRSCSSVGASSTTCSGGTCTPTCMTGYLSCSNPAPPTLDNGCECPVPNASGTPACCGASCPNAHSYDLDIAPTSTFYDCVANATYNQTVALDACKAFTGNATQCDYNGAMWSCTYPDGGAAGSMVCADGPNVANCQCWGYSGALQGYMSNGTGNGQTSQNNCLCPQAGDPQWN